MKPPPPPLSFDVLDHIERLLLDRITNGMQIPAGLLEGLLPSGLQHEWRAMPDERQRDHAQRVRVESNYGWTREEIEAARLLPSSLETLARDLQRSVLKVQVIEPTTVVSAMLDLLELDERTIVIGARYINSWSATPMPEKHAYQIPKIDGWVRFIDVQRAISELFHAARSEFGYVVQGTGHTDAFKAFWRTFDLLAESLLLIGFTDKRAMLHWSKDQWEHASVYADWVLSGRPGLEMPCPKHLLVETTVPTAAGNARVIVEPSTQRMLDEYRVNVPPNPQPNTRHSMHLGGVSFDFVTDASPTAAELRDGLLYAINARVDVPFTARPGGENTIIINQVSARDHIEAMAQVTMRAQPPAPSHFRPQNRKQRRARKSKRRSV